MAGGTNTRYVQLSEEDLALIRNTILVAANRIVLAIAFTALKGDRSYAESVMEWTRQVAKTPELL